MAPKKTEKKPAPPKPTPSTLRKTRRTKVSAPMILREPLRPLREPSAQEIAIKAYTLFEERGGAHGHDLEDWLLAERALRAGR